MRQWSGSSLVQVMAYVPLNTKSLPFVLSYLGQGLEQYKVKVFVTIAQLNKLSKRTEEQTEEADREHSTRILRPRVQWSGNGTCIILHNSDVIMGAKASLINCLTSVYSTVHSCADQRKHQSSASLPFVRGEFTGEWPVTRKMFPFDDVIMMYYTPGRIKRKLGAVSI